MCAAMGTGKIAEAGCAAGSRMDFSIRLETLGSLRQLIGSKFHHLLVRNRSMTLKYRDIDRAIKAAQKKIPILRDKALNQNLDHFCGSFAEAYRCGVEEAQQEIVSRLRALASSDNGNGDGK